MEDELLTPAEVAAVFKVAKSTVFRWADEIPPVLPALKISPKVIRFRRSDVDALRAARAS